MTRRTPRKPAIRVIRFTARIADQCASGGPRHPDRIVCDTIANGRRRATGGRGPRGGRIVLFERAYPGAWPGAGSATVSVLGEVTPEGCFALGLLPGRHPRKIWPDLGFLNRAGSK